MNALSNQKCIPCDRNSLALAKNEVEVLIHELPDWSIITENGVDQLHRSFKFKNFIDALTFTNAIGEIAEQENHHPLIELTWGKVTIRWWTHTVAGLHKNDFIMAAKTNNQYAKFTQA